MKRKTRKRWEIYNGLFFIYRTWILRYGFYVENNFTKSLAISSATQNIARSLHAHLAIYLVRAKESDDEKNFLSFLSSLFIRANMVAKRPFESLTSRAFVSRNNLAKRVVSFTVARIVNVTRELINPDTAGQTARLLCKRRTVHFVRQENSCASDFQRSIPATCHYIVNYISLGVTLTAPTSRC